MNPTSSTSPTWLALGAIALWGTLASLGVSLSHVPPFLLTGLALMVGSLVALPLSGFQLRLWRVPLPTLALGIYGLFGFHFLLFLALRHAPPVQANLVNYLWPLFMVVLAPVFLKGLTIRLGHWLGALLGFAGAAVAILGGANASIQGAPAAWGWSWGYLPALGSAFIWASYSLLTKRVPAFPTAAIGGFALVSGLLSLLCHGLMEPSASLTLQDGLLILVMGLGPMGAAFFLWDRALKVGDARQIGLLSYLTPLVSTVLLIVVSGRALTWAIALAGVLIISGAWLGADKKQA
jgi:drug/metabolite transporter (DMT)-like permease